MNGLGLPRGPSIGRSKMELGALAIASPGGLAPGLVVLVVMLAIARGNGQSKGEWWRHPRAALVLVLRPRPPRVLSAAVAASSPELETGISKFGCDQRYDC